MKKNTRVLLAGLAIIGITNAVALGGVAYNRSGEPDALVELTERELGVTRNYGIDRESSGMSLQIDCRVESKEGHSYGSSSCWGSPSWLNQQKLTELGFEFTEDMEKEYKRRSFGDSLSKEVFLVLEYDGEAYQRVLARAEEHLKAEEQLLLNNPGNKEMENRVKSALEGLRNENLVNSRLFAVDAGVDKEALRAKYPDSTTFIIMKGLVRVNRYRSNKDKQWTGTITHMPVSRINVALEYRKALDSLDVAKYRPLEERVPRYKVKVAFGKRLEPWVLRVEAFSFNLK